MMDYEYDEKMMFRCTSIVYMNTWTIQSNLHVNTAIDISQQEVTNTV